MNNLDITPQMALSAARVLRDYCKNIGASCKMRYQKIGMRKSKNTRRMDSPRNGGLA